MTFEPSQSLRASSPEGGAFTEKANLPDAKLSLLGELARGRRRCGLRGFSSYTSISLPSSSE